MNRHYRRQQFIGCVFAVLLLSACETPPAPPTPYLTPTPYSTTAPIPTATLLLTHTPTPAPTTTMVPVHTATATRAVATPTVTPRIVSWTMTELLRDWLITPHDLVITGKEIYVSGNLDRRIAVLNLEGQILRYYTIETAPEFDNVCVGVTSRGQVLALSSRGLWELRPNGEAKKIVGFGLNVGHMTIGPDDGIYVSHESRGKSIILRIDLDIARIDWNSAVTNLLTIDSDRVSDLDFDSNGDLFLADAQHGEILKYSQQRGIQVFSRGFSDPSGGGPFYLTFDKAGHLYTSSVRNHLALLSADGKMTSLEFYNASGDLVFHDGLLYTLDIYTSTLYQVDIDHTIIRTKRVLLEGTVPWYIDHQGDIIVGQRSGPAEQKFYNYHPSEPARVEPNSMLNKLQPNQYTFDDVGNMYLLFGNVLKKLTSAGREESSIVLPGKFQWDTRLHYNSADGKIYYFDGDSNSVIMASMQGAEKYHAFSSKASRVFLTATRQGKIYAAVVSSDGAKVMDISNPPQEIVIWRPSREPFWFHIASDSKGNLYAALGPEFQHVFFIDLLKGRELSIVQGSPSRYDLGFVDPQGFTVTDSGMVILSAPGVLVKFSQR